GDQVKKIGITDIRRPMDIERALLGHKPGERIPVLVARNGEELEVSLSLASRGSRPAQSRTRPTPSSSNDSLEEATWEIFGLKLQEESAQSFRSRAIPYRGGMRVTAVKPNSSADQQGVRSG